MNKDTLILIGAAALAYYIVKRPTAATTRTAKPLPTTGDFSRMDRMQAPADTVGALGEPVNVFSSAIWV